MEPVVESADSDTTSGLHMRKFKPEVFYQATMPNDVDDYQLINYGNAFVSQSSRQNNLKNKVKI